MIRTILVSLAAATVGLLGGAVGALALRGGADVAVERPATRSAPAIPLPADDAAGGVLLVWASGHLPDGLGAAVAAVDGVSAVASVASGVIDLTGSSDAAGAPVDAAPGGMAYPLDAVVVDDAFVAVAPASAAPALAAVAGDAVVLSERGAAVRRLGPGATLHVGDVALRVAGVVDDATIGAAEVAVSPSVAAALGVVDQRYLLVAHNGRRADVEQEVRRLAGAVPLRIRGPGETPYLRYGDAVLPPVAIKEVFGEFAYRADRGETVTVDPGWERDHLVAVDLPLVGGVRCHRVLVDALAGALAELEDRNLGHLVDPAGFGGCWNPRRVSGRVELSRHAWGAAVDLNVGKNLTGLASVQDPRLVEVMKRWGFTWGGTWLTPDPAHFEYVGPPARR